MKFERKTWRGKRKAAQELWVEDETRAHETSGVRWVVAEWYECELRTCGRESLSDIHCETVCILMEAPPRTPLNLAPRLPIRIAGQLLGAPHRDGQKTVHTAFLKLKRSPF